MRCKHSNIEEFIRDVNYIVRLAVRGRYLSKGIRSLSHNKGRGKKNRTCFKTLEETSLNKKSMKDISDFAKRREGEEWLKKVLERKRVCENKGKCRNGKANYSCDFTKIHL